MHPLTWSGLCHHAHCSPALIRSVSSGKQYRDMQALLQQLMLPELAPKDPRLGLTLTNTCSHTLVCSICIQWTLLPGAAAQVVHPQASLLWCELAMPPETLQVHMSMQQLQTQMQDTAGLLFLC